MDQKDKPQLDWILIAIGALLLSIAWASGEPAPLVLGIPIAVAGVWRRVAEHERAKGKNVEDLVAFLARSKANARTPPSLLIAEISLSVVALKDEYYSEPQLRELADEFVAFTRQLLRAHFDTEIGTFDVVLRSVRRGSIEIDLNVVWFVVTAVGAALGAYPKAKAGLTELFVDLQRDWTSRYRRLLGPAFSRSEVNIETVRLMTDEELQQQISIASGSVSV